MISGKFYVYELFRADGTVCYVGKGTRNRHLQHFGYGKKHYNEGLRELFCDPSESIQSRIVFRTDVEKDAFDEEMRLIAFYGRADRGLGFLCNRTDGGDGYGTGPMNDDHKLKIASALKGRMPPHAKRMQSEETKAKRAEAMRRYHASRTPEQRDARNAIIAERTRDGMNSDDVRVKCGSSHRGKPATPEMREKNRQGQLRRWGSQ